MIKNIKRAVAVAVMSTMALSLTACGSSSGNSAGKSSDKPITIRMSHTQAPNSVSDKTAKEFKKLVEEKSNGKIDVEIYTNCGLSGGDLTKAVEMVQTGDIDIHSCAPANIANFDKRFFVFWLPYLFDSTDELIEKTSEPEVQEAINSWLSPMNITMLGINNAGSRQISNNKKEIKTPEDLKGMNIRVPGANIFIDLYKDYYGANPIAMDFSEVYTSLQQGTIDGQENPISVFESSKLNEVQKYVTLWDAVRDTTIWIINKDKLESLSPENQTIIKGSANEALKWGNDYLANNEEEIISNLEDSGTVFTRLTDEQKEAFKTASEGLYDKYSDEIGQDVIDLFRK
ncbi:MAG: DctP family TRAP transporter solute-binding subunit [Clostridia bacterium]|jgi:tripartite ATP-independent transporter DctP family solute receptor|nr:DctP family TRAP transporter solute-binding subunit [Clostridia bacterium]